MKFLFNKKKKEIKEKEEPIKNVSKFGDIVMVSFKEEGKDENTKIRISDYDHNSDKINFEIAFDDRFYDELYRRFQEFELTSEMVLSHLKYVELSKRNDKPSSNKPGDLDVNISLYNNRIPVSLLMYKYIDDPMIHVKSIMDMGRFIDKFSQETGIEVYNMGDEYLFQLPNPTDYTPLGHFKNYVPFPYIIFYHGRDVLKSRMQLNNFIENPHLSFEMRTRRDGVRANVELQQSTTDTLSLEYCSDPVSFNHFMNNRNNREE